MVNTPDGEQRKAWKAESNKLIGTLRLLLVAGHGVGLVILFGAVTQGAVSLNIYTQALGVMFVVGAACAFVGNYFTALALRGWGTGNYDIGNRMSAISDAGLYIASALLLIGMIAPLFLPILNTHKAPASVETVAPIQPVAASPSPEPQAPPAVHAPIATPPTLDVPMPSAASAPVVAPAPEEQAPPSTTVH